MPSVWLLIGHRGSGKSALLERLKLYCSQAGVPVEAIDLDRKIDEREGVTLSEIFQKHGEAHFRNLERQTLKELLAAPRQRLLIVALGAGFEGPIPEGGRCIWVRRPTDSQGRIFLDPERRPRLEQDQSQLEEFHRRAGARNSRYSAWADEQWYIPEGGDAPNDAERFFFGFGGSESASALPGRNGVITLLPELFEPRERLTFFLSRRRDWGFRFEIRDDLLNPEQISRALSILPPEQTLFSVRRGGESVSPSIAKIPAGVIWDWPLELGRVPEGRAPQILSLHERSPGPLEATLQRLESARDSASLPESTWLKLAVEIHDFKELEKGHDWAMQDPVRRAFLPRSLSGRWKWYRLFSGPNQPLAFIRDAGAAVFEASVPDQPCLSEWLAMAPLGNPPAFAAVLGDPVAHSRTPFEQREIFAKRGWPVFAIQVSEKEWDQGALATLARLGLRAAAVTSPLKKKAYETCSTCSDVAQSLGSVNTLALGASGWIGHNTDFEGLRALLEKAGISSPGEEEVAVWGGGGTLPLLKELLPRARFFSARTGEPRDGKPVPKDFSPWFVLWGVGRTRQQNAAWPPPHWKVGCVVDLNYSEDSPGRELALERGALYVSGLEMFRTQAEGQREFWSENLSTRSL